MTGSTTRARAAWIADRVTALPEVWALVALHLGLVGAWRPMLVCKAARMVGGEGLSQNAAWTRGQRGENNRRWRWGQCEAGVAT